MHIWNDDWPYWDDLNAAIEYFGRLIRKYRLNAIQIKEKYGTLRCYMGPLWWSSIHDITHPGHCFIRYKSEWLVNVNHWCHGSRLWWWLVGKPSSYLHAYLYRRAYRKTIKKWPHLKREILCCADYDEMLEGL